MGGPPAPGAVMKVARTVPAQPRASSALPRHAPRRKRPNAVLLIPFPPGSHLHQHALSPPSLHAASRDGCCPLPQIPSRDSPLDSSHVLHSLCPAEGQPRREGGRKLIAGPPRGSHAHHRPQLGRGGRVWGLSPSTEPSDTQWSLPISPLRHGGQGGEQYRGEQAASPAGAPGEVPRLGDREESLAPPRRGCRGPQDPRAGALTPRASERAA